MWYSFNIFRRMTQKIETVVDDEDDVVKYFVCRLSSSSLSSSSRRPSLPRAVSRLFSRSLDPAERSSRYPSSSTSSSSPSSGRKNAKLHSFSLLTLSNCLTLSSVALSLTSEPLNSPLSYHCFVLIKILRIS